MLWSVALGSNNGYHAIDERVIGEFVSEFVSDRLLLALRICFAKSTVVGRGGDIEGFAKGWVCKRSSGTIFDPASAAAPLPTPLPSGT